MLVDDFPFGQLVVGRFTRHGTLVFEARRPRVPPSAPAGGKGREQEEQVQVAVQYVVQGSIPQGKRAMKPPRTQAACHGLYATCKGGGGKQLQNPKEVHPSDISAPCVQACCPNELSLSNWVWQDSMPRQRPSIRVHPFENWPTIGNFESDQGSEACAEERETAWRRARGVEGGRL